MGTSGGLYMQQQLIQLYNDYMRTKQFDISYYRRLSAIVRQANDNSSLSQNLRLIWNRTDTRKYCLDTCRQRFIAVMATIMPLIQNGV